MLTQKRLKEVLKYDPRTGVFTNRRSRIGVTAYKVAGSIKKDGYVCIMIDKKAYTAHRLAWFYMTGEWPKNQIDHINHVRSDNRFSNLREATNEENSRNLKLFSNNRSGFSGVSWNKRHKKWYSKITINKKEKFLGSFDKKEDAIKARIEANKKYGYHENHGKAL